ncbi:MAG: AAA family ATPase [Bacteroidales bacterium]|nr:AAA family ATPase [Bacteroidales bacterium]MCF8390136.1 AAA family ATPase [Bacteroidales bacterium]
MDRYIFFELRNWVHKTRRKPLLLRGARQVGKTWLVEKLAQIEFENFLKIDFEENPELLSLFEGDLNPEKICAELEIRTGIDILMGKTLLFIDEIQICPRAIIALRYFYEKMPKLHIIAAGSLLEFALSEISFPVGRIQILEVYPMNFSEFLLALGYKKAADICNDPITDVTETTHEFLMEQLRIYLLVGGMPECIKEYVNTKSIKKAADVQDEICETYQMDFVKYKPKTDVNCLSTVFLNIAASVGQQTKYTGLAKDFTIPTIKNAYESIVLARIASKVKSVSSPGVPLELHASDKKFKNLFLDIGLMNRVMKIDYHEALSHKNLLAIYRGQLAEQFVGQELLCATNKQLYYWARDAKNSKAEIDYLFQKEGTIFPVEVKDGPSGKLKSLHLYRNTYGSQLAVVFHAGITGKLEEENIIFLPLYFAGSFARHGV